MAMSAMVIYSSMAKQKGLWLFCGYFPGSGHIQISQMYITFPASL